MDFFEFFSIEFAACLKQPSRDNHCKSLLRGRYNVAGVRVAPKTCDQGRRKIQSIIHVLKSQGYGFEISLMLRWI